MKHKISLLSPIILPLQRFFSRVLLRRQQVFSPGNFARQRPNTRITTIKTQVFMFRYERVTSTGKFTIVAKIVFLLKKIHKGDDLCRAVFKVKTLAVLFPPYYRKMKTNTAKFKSTAILALAYFYGNCVTHSHARQNRAWLKHVHSFDRCVSVGSITSRCSSPELRFRRPM